MASSKERLARLTAHVKLEQESELRDPTLRIEQVEVLEFPKSLIFPIIEWKQS